MLWKCLNWKFSFEFRENRNPFAYSVRTDFFTCWADPFGQEGPHLHIAAGGIGGLLLLRLEERVQILDRAHGAEGSQTGLLGPRTSPPL